MKTLIIIDVQNDFLPNGALAVEGGDKIISVINSLMPSFDHVFATMDWHPEKHMSFASTHQKNVGEQIQIGGQTQVLWPAHCVQQTKGAALSDQLDQGKIEEVFYKGTDPDVESYSAFFDTQGNSATNLSSYLKKNSLNELFFVGLATNYCVKDTVFDALKLGFSVSVIVDGCKGIDLTESQEKELFNQMCQKGAKIISSKDFN